MIIKSPKFRIVTVIFLANIILSSFLFILIENYDPLINNDTIIDREIFSEELQTSTSLDWDKLWRINLFDYGESLAVDSSGYIYMVGTTQDSNIEIVKFNSEGNEVWNRTWGNNQEVGKGIAVDSSNNLYISGYGWSFGAGSADMYLVKYNSSGDFQWNQTWGGSESDEASRVVVDLNNDIYQIGQTKSFGGTDFDMTIVKYNNFGVQLWNQTWGGSNDDGAYDVAVDTLDNVYLVGYTKSYATKGPRDICVVKYNSAGSQIWNTTWGVWDIDEGYGIDVDSSYNVYVAGYFTEFGYTYTDSCLLKFNSSGAYQWNKTWGESYDDEGHGVVVDSDDNIYFSGFVDKRGSNYQDVIVIKCNNTGAELWNSTWDGGRREYGLDIDFCPSDGNLYVGGYSEALGGQTWFLLLKYIQIPGSFILDTNADNPDIDGSFILNWGESEDAINYSIYQHNNFITEINNSITLLDEGITALTYSISGLENGTYYYKAVAFNQFGNSSTNCIQVNVQRLPPGTLSLTTNAHDPDIDGTFNLNWTASDHASNYSVYRHNSYISQINATVFEVDSGLTNLSYIFEGMDNGTYYFKVVSFNENGNISSNCIQVKVLRYLPKPFTLSSTADNPDADGIFNLNWTSSDYADTYSIYQSNRTITEINSTVLLIDKDITKLTYLMSGLNNGTYYFLIVAFNTNGNTSSNCIQIDVLISPPGFFNLSSDADIPDTDGAFTLTWNQSSGADNYSVYWSYYPITVFNSSVHLINDGITALLYPFTGFPNNDYYFIVVAFNQNGNATSNYIKVIVRLPPQAFTLSSDAESPDLDGSFTLNWTSSDYAVNYSTYWSYNPITEFDNGVYLIKDGITSLFCSITGFLNNDYYFVVVAFNQIGNSTSNYIKVMVRFPPQAFTLSSDAESPDLDGIFNLNWTSSDYAINYSIYYSNKPIFEINDTTSLYKVNITQLECVITGLEEGIYYFIVFAYNSYGNYSSNYIQITIDYPEQDDPFFLIIIISIIFSLIAIGTTSYILIRKRRKKIINLKDQYPPGIVEKQYRPEKIED
jgi:uncharacterized delta-60 repeat protein